jgi:hypothetical protein
LDDAKLSQSMTPLDVHRLTSILGAMGAECDAIKIERAKKYVDHILTRLGHVNNHPITYRDAGHLLRELDNNIRWDMEEELFFHIPWEHKTYFNNERLLGDTVFESFKQARSDIKEAGNCLACGNYTAAVFQFMRVAERGLRRLARALKVTITHTKTPIPLEYGEWDKIITEIKNKIAPLRVLPQGPKRQAKLEAYSDAADHCTFMKDIWRNTVSHTRKPYTDREALAVMGRVGDFMQFLATQLRGL